MLAEVTTLLCKLFKDQNLKQIKFHKGLLWGFLIPRVRPFSIELPEASTQAWQDPKSRESSHHRLDEGHSLCLSDSILP